MANNEDYLTSYREFFEDFAKTVNPNDQLPVRLASYKLINLEVVGGIIDWTTQYLNQKKCPPHLTAPLIKTIIEEIRSCCKKEPLSFGFNPADNAYEPLKLMQAVMAKTNEVCLRYLDNSMLCSLPAPGSPFFVTSVCAIKNSRRRMEDRHTLIHDLNTIFNIQETSPSSYYAIFDGHAGLDAAAYSSAHLHQFLAENKHFASNPEQALVDAFCKTDALFIDKCKVESLSSGTTAVVALLRPKEKTLYIAWAGDSQALLVNQGRLLQCVDPHKPTRKDERDRIEKAGGCVIMWGTWRVNGQLAVSRAIGDPDYKPHVTAVPDVREISLDGNEDFLILACDGLWDFVSEDTAAKLVYYMVSDNPDETDRISDELAKLSRQQGSNDNISVIVVFLREPSKIAADYHRRAGSHGTPSKMEAAGLDNANCPFSNANGTSGNENILGQKPEGLLLNFTDNFTLNGTNLSSTTFEKGQTNGKKSTSDFSDEDFGPETDVDAVDEAILKSPSDVKRVLEDSFGNNNPAGDPFTNPFIEHKEKAAFEIEEGIHKLQDSECEEENLRREETPTPPVDAVQDVAGLDNAAESDSEDEWNYFKGEEANKENIPQPNKEVGEPLEEEDNMSQLNPNAAEFVPVSPTRSIPSPIHRALLNDEVIAQSPKRPVAVDINVPNESDFEKEVKSRPSDFDSYSNGHGESGHDSSAEVIDNLLNGKSVDEIPEFQPGSTPTKTSPSEEFHFGPNAAPFTPAKLLDQSEAALSTKAVYGDESAATIGTSFNESELVITTDLDVLNKESDPMSASFYAEEGESNPFDLDKVHVLPDNLDEFLKDTGDKAIDNIVTNLPEEESLLMDDTISDLPEHNPLESIANNDEAVLIQTTDLDKPSSYEEKELASPLEPEKELEDIEASKQPQDDLLSDFIVCDPHPQEIAESPLPEYTSDFAKSPDHGLPDSTSPVCDLPESKSPVCNLPESPVSDLPDTKSPVCDLPESKSPVPESRSPVCDLPESKSPVFDLPESKSPVCDLPESKSPVCELSLSKSPILNLQEQDSPLVEHKSFEVDQHVNEIPQFADNLNAVEKLESEISVPIDESSRNLQSEIEKIPEETSLVCDIIESNSLIQDTAAEVSSTVCDIPATESLVCDIPQPKLDLPLHQSHELEVHQTEEKEVSLQEDITSSVKDVSSPIQDLSPDVSKDVLGGFVPQDITFETNHPQDIPLEMNQFEQGNILPDILSSSASEIANDVHGFVENIQASEMHFEQQIVTEEVLVKPTPDILDLHEEPSKPEHIDIKTENIIPQYAEQAILTPSEEPSRKEDLIEEPVKIEEPLKLAEEPVKIEEPAVEEESKKEDISAPAVALVEPLVQETKEDLVPAVLTQPIVPEEKEAKDVKKEVKKAAAAAPPKKPIGKVQPTTKPLLKSPAAPKAAPAKAAPGTKPVPPKTTTARPPITATRLAPSTKPAPKPAPRTTTTTASRTITDKKPLQNGDIKTTTKSTTTVKKTESKLSATKLSSTTTTKSSATLTKTSGSPTKTAPTRPATVPSRTVGAVPPARTGATAAKTSTRPASSTAALPKTTTRPSTLTSSKSATGTVSARTSASKLTSTTPKAASPKTAIAPPKPKPALSSPPKPRVPLTRTKAPDTEKQNKESANKLTASKNVTNKTSTTTTGSITSRVNSVRKTEPKTLTSSRTKSTTTTTTTTKSTTGKKPEEITRMVTKTKTTKIEKPKENGVSTVVTEEITVVNNVNNVSDVLNNVNNVSDVMNNVNDVINNVDQLLKDNSPIDNKLITEVVNTAD